MRLLHLVPFVLSGLVGCSDYTVVVDTRPEHVAQPGTINGRVCDVSGRSWLADGHVYTNIFDSNGRVIDLAETYSDRDGFWTLDDLAPNREYTIYAQSGSAVVWSETLVLGDGETINIPEPACFDPASLNIAVIAGDYDEMNLLLQNMGFVNYTVVDGLDADVLKGFLTDPNNLEPYDIVFFNGGHVEKYLFYDTNPANTTPALIATTLQDYVAAGGSVYASDWAYDVVEAIWPDAIDFLGDDYTPNAAQLGDYDNVDAVVTDTAMAEYLGSQTAHVAFDLPVWPAMNAVEPYVSIHLTGTVHYREGQESYTLASVPLLVSFSGGKGRVAFSSFRVAANQTEEMMSIFQYMMYDVSK